MHCMLMDLLHGFEVLSTTEETLFNSRQVVKFFWIIVIRFKLGRAKYKHIPAVFHTRKTSTNFLIGI